MICTVLRWTHSLIIHCEKEMSPDEAGDDLDLQHKLDVTEVEKIHSLY